MIVDIKAPPGFTLKPGHSVGIHTANGGGCCTVVVDENGKEDFSESLRLWEHEDHRLALPASDPLSSFHPLYGLMQEMRERRENEILDILSKGS